ncbi:MAG: FAD binding domain-containing protein [Dehalococcoidia bacterium]|nr:FAD binding domain-containing protein [Dehalococcoidia bacterium]
MTKSIVPTGLPSFRLERPTTLDEALHKIADGGLPLAGGSDLLGMMKDGICSPSSLVHLGGIAELNAIEMRGEAVRIGACVTLRDVTASTEVRERAPVLANAAAQVGSPQIRNVATLGGNLCQKPRCWFYRSRLFLCTKKGGDTCFAQEFDRFMPRSSRPSCVAAHPSDLAPVLLALEASMNIADKKSSRTMSAEKFFQTSILANETVLAPGQLLLSVDVPGLTPDQRAAFIRVEERDSWGFASVAVAVVLSLDGEYIRNARIALGSFARLPYRAHEAEEALRGHSINSPILAAVGSLAIQSVPLTDTQLHKGEVAVTILRRAIQHAAAAS